MPKAWLLSPYPAPIIAAFGEKGPQGSGKDAARFRRGWEAPSENPLQMREAQDQGGIGAAISLVSFFSIAGMQEVEQCREQLPRPNKRKKLGCRSENRLLTGFVQRLLIDTTTPGLSAFNDSVRHFSYHSEPSVKTKPLYFMDLTKIPNSLYNR